MSEPVPDREMVLAAIRESVTVVKPGEVLVIRVPLQIPRDAIHRYQAQADEVCEQRSLGIKILIVAAEELAVVQADTDEAFARRVGKAMGKLDRRRRFPMGAA